MHINGQYKTRSNGNGHTCRQPGPRPAGSQCNRTDRHSRLSLRQASWRKTDTSQRITTGVSEPLLPRNTIYRSCAKGFLYCPCRTSFSFCNCMKTGKFLRAALTVTADWYKSMACENQSLMIAPGCRLYCPGCQSTIRKP